VRHYAVFVSCLTRLVKGAAAFLDLHDLLPDAAFADHLDHLVQDVEPEGSRAVADRLAPLVAERIQDALAAKAP
jgi:hypothetical protein